MLAIAAVAVLNVNLNSQSDKLSELSLANVEALATEAASYKWSEERDCPGIGTGHYHACESNGTGNSCSSGGSTTCTCGTNC
ncbi:MAG: hypothetical protein LBE13_00830 [Bacteroidales bacterium]|nr:hypothetical protein [Bacteroidales bacterium]